MCFYEPWVCVALRGGKNDNDDDDYDSDSDDNSAVILQVSLIDGLL